MRKLEFADADVMRIAIQQEIQRLEESWYDHRLHGQLPVTGGQSYHQVARLFDEVPRTVQRGIRTFEQCGFDGLRDSGWSGRPRTHTPAQWSSLERDLRRRPDDFGLAANLRDGNLLSKHLRCHYGVKLGVRQCQRLFRQMGFRYRKPRPQMTQEDPQRVAEFKNCARWQNAKTLSYGARTNATFSATAPAVASGCRPRRKTPSSCTRRCTSPSSVSGERSVCRAARSFTTSPP